MSQADLGSLIGTTSGVALRTMLTAMNGALNTGNSGSSRPSYAVAGTIWIDTSVAPKILKYYDGAADTPLGYIDETNDRFTPGIFFKKGADIASASPSLANATGNFVHITGTTAITALGTVPSGFMAMLVFDGILTFTHNGTSLILPGAANITTAAGDTAVMVSEGSGNWRCIDYMRAARGPNPGWELIDYATPTAVASYTKTGLSAFRRLRMSGWLRPATDAVSILLRTDANGGASYDSGASDYPQQRLSAALTAVVAAAVNIDGIYLNVANTVGNAGAASQEGAWFNIEFMEWNQARPCFFNMQAGNLNASTNPEVITVQGYRNDANARDAIQAICSSGNIALGQITLEGIRG